MGPISYLREFSGIYSFSGCTAKAGVDIFDCCFFRFLPAAFFFSFRRIPVFFESDGIVRPPRIIM